ncbi:branched-chain amino acid ABC transporter ATP-binding protein/permease [Nakamurella lactea]|uniref:branched-chain amino acid ABC transporter ATP-binding protein/permease n=1 Tax=Nakamurella lactea TaxID=459515 RepID=UPI000421DBD3|nr:branched-chain amino acid ABC transporter ATP-binding protein/permease [Nakamurella lactea]
MRYRLVVLALAAVAAWVLPYGLSLYAIHVVDVAIVFAILAIGMGLVMGIAGQINLAQVAFFGVGAYMTAVLTTHVGMGFWTAAVLSVIGTAVVGLLVGTPALRMQSHYLGIVTLGLAVAFVSWATNSPLAGGASGISGIPAPTLFGLDLSSEYLFYYFELIVFACALAFGMFIVRMPLGRRMRAMRDDALAAGAVGAEVRSLRMAAFALASVYGGLAGVLYAGLIRYVAPETFSIANMFLLLAMVIIGGRHSLVGCVVGALGLSLLREALVDVSTYAQLAYGAVVALTVVFAPNGLAGLPGRVRSAWGRRRPDKAAVLGDFQPYEPASPDVVGGPDRDDWILDVRGVGKRFRGLIALQDVSFQVRAGEIRGIVGPNGSGKTTLFNVISGLYKPSSGQVIFAGKPATGRPPHQLAHAGMARTFQNLRLFHLMSVRENVLVGLDRSRIRSIWRYLLWPIGVFRDDREMHRAGDELLARFGLVDFAPAAPRSLPYGTQRRVEIARAMAGRPRLLLLDEPAAGLNGEEVRQLGEIVRSIRASGVTVIIIEHNMGLVMSMCERITVLASGSVIAEGTPAEVSRTPEVIEAYLGDAEVNDNFSAEDELPPATVLDATP